MLTFFILCFSIVVFLFVLIVICAPTMRTTAGASAAGRWFPVLVHIDDKLNLAGHVKLTPALDFDAFRALLSHLIGAPPNRIAAYLLDTANAATPRDYKWKADVSWRTDFRVVSQLQDCCFLALLAPQPRPDPLGLRRPDYPTRRQSKNADETQPRRTRQQQDPRLVCEKCSVAKEEGVAAEFHHCVLDAIVDHRYISNAGPIGPYTVQPEVQKEDESAELYSLFGPMPRVDSLRGAVNDWLLTL